MERLEAFEKMLSDIREQTDYETAQMEKLKAAGKEKSATYRQYFGNRVLYKMMLEKYKEYGLWIVSGSRGRNAFCGRTSGLQNRKGDAPYSLWQS